MRCTGPMNAPGPPPTIPMRSLRSSAIASLSRRIPSFPGPCSLLLARSLRSPGSRHPRQSLRRSRIPPPPTPEKSPAPPLLAACQSDASACASATPRRAACPSPSARSCQWETRPAQSHSHSRPTPPIQSPASWSARPPRSCSPHRPPAGTNPRNAVNDAILMMRP